MLQRKDKKGEIKPNLMLNERSRSVLYCFCLHLIWLTLVMPTPWYLLPVYASFGLCGKKSFFFT